MSSVRVSEKVRSSATDKMRFPFRKNQHQSPFLVVRHQTYQRHEMDIVLHWARRNAPAVLRDFEFHDLCDLPPSTGEYRVCLFWLQDPIQKWCLKSYAQAVRLEQWCEQRGIAMVNRPSHLTNAGKANGSRLISMAGLRTPNMFRIRRREDLQIAFQSLPSPIILREDWGHGGPMTLVNSQEEVDNFDLSQFVRPVALEWVDASSPDGHFRKYRYVVAGTHGIPLHLQMSQEWLTRGSSRLKNAATAAEEVEYLTKADQNGAALQSAAQKLGLDFVAFDYGYDQGGQPIVWEANPFPHLHFSRGKSLLKYRNFAVHATLRTMLLSYYEAACMEAPQVLVSCVNPILPRAPMAWKRPYYRTREWIGAQRRRFLR